MLCFATLHNFIGQIFFFPFLSNFIIFPLLISPWSSWRTLSLWHNKSPSLLILPYPFIEIEKRISSKMISSSSHFLKVILFSQANISFNLWSVDFQCFLSKTRFWFFDFLAWFWFQAKKKMEIYLWLWFQFQAKKKKKQIPGKLFSTLVYYSTILIFPVFHNNWFKSHVSFLNFLF